MFTLSGNYNYTMIRKKITFILLVFSLSLPISFISQAAEGPVPLTNRQPKWYKSKGFIFTGATVALGALFGGGGYGIYLATRNDERETNPPSWPTTPTVSPTNFLSYPPSESPTISITVEPSSSPSTSPTEYPTSSPSGSPSAMPSRIEPTMMPTKSPSYLPSEIPSSAPTTRPSYSLRPSVTPSQFPSSRPTGSVKPSSAPSSVPSSKPTQSIKPSSTPSSSPTISAQPSLSIEPSESPTITEWDLVGSVDSLIGYVGTSLCLSKDGNTLAFSTTVSHSENRPKVQVYKYFRGHWKQVGPDTRARLKGVIHLEVIYLSLMMEKSL